MNANELADLIGLCGDGGYNQDAATMLRQQADLIRTLQKSLGFKNSGYETINLTPPVAWINLDRFKDEALYLADCVSENKVENMGITTPLYTHPAKTLIDDPLVNFKPVWQEKLELTLTDEEILEFRDKVPYSLGSDLIEFARAILRKAQKK